MAQKVFDIRKRSYLFGLGVVRFIETLPSDISTKIIASQLLRAATSVGANILEARAASSRRDFMNFYSHSLKSANECIFWINLLIDAGKASSSTIRELLNEATELGNIIASSILTIKRTRSNLTNK